MIRFLGEYKFITGIVLYLAGMALLSSIAYFSNVGGLRQSMQPPPQGTTVYEIPRLTMSLAASGAGHGSARLGIDLKVERKDLALLETYMPRILDRIQSYMHKVLIDELRNMSGLTWLRTDLLREVNLVSGPVRILALTFRELVLT